MPQDTRGEKPRPRERAVMRRNMRQPRRVGIGTERDYSHAPDDDTD